MLGAINTAPGIVRGLGGHVATTEAAVWLDTGTLVPRSFLSIVERLAYGLVPSAHLEALLAMGLGDSEKTFVHAQDRFLAYMESRHEAPVVGVGSSQGGIVLAKLALLYPQYFHAVVWGGVPFGGSHVADELLRAIHSLPLSVRRIILARLGCLEGLSTSSLDLEALRANAELNWDPRIEAHFFAGTTDLLVKLDSAYGLTLPAATRQRRYSIGPRRTDYPDTRHIRTLGSGHLVVAGCWVPAMRQVIVRLKRKYATPVLAFDSPVIETAQAA